MTQPRAPSRRARQDRSRSERSHTAPVDWSGECGAARWEQLLGAPIARLEAQIGLRKLVEGLPNLRLAGTPERINSWIYYGQRQLPVAWD